MPATVNVVADTGYLKVHTVNHVHMHATGLLNATHHYLKDSHE